MSAQRYTDPVARGRMVRGLCPECGEEVGKHVDDSRFWIPRVCTLLPRGVEERLEQFIADGGA